jgi:competence protein ComEC
MREPGRRARLCGQGGLAPSGFDAWPAFTTRLREWVRAEAGAGRLRQKLFPVAVMIASVAAGFATATWKTARIAHGVLARPMYSVSVSGFVEARDVRERTDRFVLRVTQMDAARSPIKLERVRLSVRKGTAPAVGSFVELKARLQPPLAPLRPGSYDFGRDMFFQGIGASGFVTGARC